MWSRDGRTLLYYDGHAIVSMPVPPHTATTNGRAWPAATPARVMEAPWMTERLGPLYSVARDGRLLVMRDENDEAQADWRHIVVVERWADRVLAPPGAEATWWQALWPFRRRG